MHNLAVRTFKDSNSVISSEWYSYIKEKSDYNESFVRNSELPHAY